MSILVVEGTPGGEVCCNISFRLSVNMYFDVNYLIHEIYRLISSTFILILPVAFAECLSRIVVSLVTKVSTTL
jgi:hypothetical protein